MLCSDDIVFIRLASHRTPRNYSPPSNEQADEAPLHAFLIEADIVIDLSRPWLFARQGCLCYSCCIPFARVLLFLFSTNGAIGTECIGLRTNGSVKTSCRMNFNLHGEGFYCCCWFTSAKCLTSSGIFRLLRGLFVPERCEARSKISSMLLRSASPNNGTKGECKLCTTNGWHRQRVIIIEHQQPRRSPLKGLNKDPF